MFEGPDWKLLRISGGLAGSMFQGRAIKWIMNRNHQRRGNRPVKACAKRRPGKKQKTRAKRDTIWPKALIASKNALKAPMEKARKKNRKVELYSRFAVRGPLARSCAEIRPHGPECDAHAGHWSGTIIWPTRGCRPYASGPDVTLARSDATGQGGSGGKPRT